METYTWNGIVKRADNKPHLSPELRAKDEARFQINEYAKSMGEEDAEKYDCPEERIDEYALKYDLRFDDRGNIL